MTRRITFPWPDQAAFRDREGEPIRVLAVSDEPDQTLDHQHNREQLGRIDLVVGCGDLDRDHLGFLGDAFHAPVHYVRGNHDRGVNWQQARPLTPEPIPDGRIDRAVGLLLVGLSWPGQATGRASRDGLAAWGQALGAAASVARHGKRPLLLLSHVPPLGAGDDPTDPYHTGFAAYRWLLRRLHPPLWLHGHTTVATVASTRVEFEGTSLINVTGSVLVTLEPAPDR